jgi:glycosyltransferase involved in cell wall biosynthesis
MTIAPFFFFVHNQNHVRLLVPVAERLRAQNCAVTFVDVEASHYREGAVLELHRLGSSSVSIEEFAKWPPSRGVFVLANDWAPILLIEFLDRLGRDAIKLVGVVDGCRFALPDRYTKVDYVLGWGPSSRTCFKQTVIIAGSPIIEAARARQVSYCVPPLVAVNYKFTYKYTGLAQSWIASVVRACEKIGLPYALSAHPSNRSTAPGAIPIEDINRLLDRASVLVTRPSTVAYEAMARGTPVVLFPIPGEPLVEFKQPMGAFEVTCDADALPDLISDALLIRDDYKSRCRKFLEYHVEFGTQGEAIARIVMALTTIAAEV